MLLEPLNKSLCQRYLAIAAATSIVLMVCVGALNFYVDPANLFVGRKEIVEKVASELKKGNFVEVIYSLDDRYLQEVVVRDMQEAPDVVITGSSRSRNIGHDLFPSDLKVQNNSVNSAVLEDHIAVYSLYDQRGKLPKHAIIDVDPWLFNENYSFANSASLQSHVLRLEKKMGYVPQSPTNNSVLTQRDFESIVLLSKLREAFSGAQLRASFEFIKTHGLRKADMVTLRPSDDPNFIYRPDGSYRWGLYLYNETEDKQKKRMQKSEANMQPPGEVFYQLVNFTKISEERRRLFEIFVKYLTERGVHVTLVMLPYHPWTYDNYLQQSGKIKIIGDVQQYVLSLRSSDIEVIGSFNPHDYGCIWKDFVDEHHPLPSCSSKIVAEWRSR